MLWTAPELLRLLETDLPYNGSRPGDVFSLGLIIQEIVFRCLPYQAEDKDPQGRYRAETVRIGVKEMKNLFMYSRPGACCFLFFFQKCNFSYTVVLYTCTVQYYLRVKFSNPLGFYNVDLVVYTHTTQYNRTSWNSRSLRQAQPCDTMLTPRRVKRIFFLLHSLDMSRIQACFNCYVYTFIPEIIEKVKAAQSPPYRPSTKEGGNVDQLALDLMSRCWQEDPECRPSLAEVKDTLKALNKGKLVTGNNWRKAILFITFVVVVVVVVLVVVVVVVAANTKFTPD